MLEFDVVRAQDGEDACRIRGRHRRCHQQSRPDRKRDAMKPAENNPSEKACDAASQQHAYGG